MAYLQYTREEWLKEKAASVSSTESPAIFGASPYLTAYELAVMKQAGDVPEIESTDRMRWGTRLQDAIAQGIADDYGVIIESQEYAYAHHPSVKRMGSSFDYMIVGVDEKCRGTSALAGLFEQHGPGILEIKNVDALQYRNWPEHEAPDHIEIQVQHQLEVSRLEWAVLGVLVGGNRTEVYTRMRDGEAGFVIARRVREFWENLDKGVLPPPVLPADAEIIIRLHQYADPNKVFDGQSDVTLASLCDEYANCVEVVREASEAQKSIKAQILKHIGDAERALTDGYRVHCGMRAPVHVAAHTRGGYRDFRVTKVKAEETV